jgi:hypothetical protein
MMRRDHLAFCFLILLATCSGAANEPVSGQPAHHAADQFQNTNPFPPVGMDALELCGSPLVVDIDRAANLCRAAGRQ